MNNVMRDGKLQGTCFKFYVLQIGKDLQSLKLKQCIKTEFLVHSKQTPSSLQRLND